MKMTACTSSQVAAHGYDPVSKVLAIEFKSGGVYHYSGVSQDEYDSLCKAPSIGKHIHANIKGRYPFKKQ